MSFKKEKFSKVLYFAHGGSGSGESAADPKPIVDNASIFVLEAGMVVQQASVVVTTAVTGTTAVDVGDAGDPDGFVKAADITLGTPGAYVGTGAYIASDIEKYYASAGALALDITGTSTAGAFAVMVEGYKL